MTVLALSRHRADGRRGEKEEDMEQNPKQEAGADLRGADLRGASLEEAIQVDRGPHPEARAK